MSDIVQFVLGGFWHFVGAMFIIGALGRVIVRCVRGYPPQYIVEAEKPTFEWNSKND